MIPTTRFAPSPTGFLHIGHAKSAWFTAEHGDDFILRIEDIDQTRCRPEFETAIYEDLKWLGLNWKNPARKQSNHFDEYQTALHKLDEMGLLYSCFCSRKGVEDSIYPRNCAHMGYTEQQDKIASGAPFSLRLDLEKAIQRTGELSWYDCSHGKQIARPEIFGDVILARKDTPASYHLCVTHDDALQNINLVTRGEDLFTATHIHRVLQELLGFPVPEYHHHPLITYKNGQKFSKRDKSLTIREVRNKGFSPDQLRDIIDTQILNSLTD